MWFFFPTPHSSDEDMQSLASLMSMKQADIGNLDDFEEENEEDEENRVNQEEKAAKITGEQLECFTSGSSWQNGRIATSASSPTSAFQKKKKKNLHCLQKCQT